MNFMTLTLKALTGLGAAAAMVACAGPTSPVQNDPSERALSGVAPAGTDQLVAIDADGRSFATDINADGSFRLAIPSTAAVSVFLIGDSVRVLRVSPSAGTPSTQSTLPAWTGEVSTAQMSTCDCNADGVDEDAEGEDNVLEQIDSDDDGASDYDDDDDDDDGINDDDDDDRDGSGRDDDDEDLDTDNDGRPDRCDDDDDDDGILDDDDDDGGDSDDDGVADDDDLDDDNDGEDDDDGDDDDTDDDDDIADSAG